MKNLTGKPQEPALLHRVAWRLIPFLGLLYIFAFLDRVNIGFAALTMNADLGFSATVFGNGAGIFFIGYVLFEVPSNLLLHKLGARRWIARIMVSWGLLSASMAFVRGPSEFYVLRFLLGIAEAGFFPGMILYLTYWFPSQQRTRILATFMVALPLASVIGAPVSSYLLDLRLGDFRGWQWLFLWEGMPAALVGLCVLRVLSDRPENATWLDADERKSLVELLALDRLAQSSTDKSVVQALTSPAVWLLGLLYFALLIGLYGFSFWLPQIIQHLGSLTHPQIAVLTMLPNILSAVVMYGWARHSAVSNERRWHFAIPAFLAAFGLAAASQMSQPSIVLVALTLSAVGIYTTLPIFWTFPAAFLEGSAAAGGFALINAVGNIGGYLGPALMGYSKEALGNYSAGLGVLACSLAVTGALALRLKSAH